MLNGRSIVPDESTDYFRFKKMTIDEGLDESDLFTLTWFYRAFGLYQPIPPREQRFFSQRTIDFADRFISLWICFNSILRKHYGEDSTDGELIREANIDFRTDRATIPLKRYYELMKDHEYDVNLRELESPLTNKKYEK